MTFADCLTNARGQLIKARREYMRYRKWRDVDWYKAWPNGLADEVEAAVTCNTGR